MPQLTSGAALVVDPGFRTEGEEKIVNKFSSKKLSLELYGHGEGTAVVIVARCSSACVHSYLPLIRWNANIFK